MNAESSTRFKAMSAVAAGRPTAYRVTFRNGFVGTTTGLPLSAFESDLINTGFDETQDWLRREALYMRRTAEEISQVPAWAPGADICRFLEALADRFEARASGVRN